VHRLEESVNTDEDEVVSSKKTAMDKAEEAEGANDG
jgi:hypothetical protein